MSLAGRPSPSTVAAHWISQHTTLNWEEALPLTEVSKPRVPVHRLSFIPQAELLPRVWRVQLRWNVGVVAAVAAALKAPQDTPAVVARVAVMLRPPAFRLEPARLILSLWARPARLEQPLYPVTAVPVVVLRYPEEALQRSQRWEVPVVVVLHLIIIAASAVLLAVYIILQ